MDLELRELHQGDRLNQAVRVQAVSLGHALDLDRADCGVVHSVFARAVNLLVRGELWTLLAEEKADLPFGFRLALPNSGTVRCRRGEPVNIRAGFVGVGSGLIVDCRAARRWVPRYAQKLEPGLERRLDDVAEAVRGRSWRESAVMAQAIRSAILGEMPLEVALRGMIGRGPGATPSGDDVLIGVLAVLTSSLSGEAGRRAAGSLARALVPLLPNTTDLSGHLLRQAMRGLVGRDVQELIAALLGAPTPGGLGMLVRRVLDTGATSGADLSEGLRAVAPSFFGSHNQRISV